MTDTHTPWRHIRRQVSDELSDIPEPRLIEKRGRVLRYYIPADDGVAELVTVLREKGYCVGWDDDWVYVEVEI